MEEGTEEVAGRISSTPTHYYLMPQLFAQAQLSNEAGIRHCLHQDIISNVSTPISTPIRIRITITITVKI